MLYRWHSLTRDTSLFSRWISSSGMRGMGLVLLSSHGLNELLIII
jgi:hypothetical protein